MIAVSIVLYVYGANRIYYLTYLYMEKPSCVKKKLHSRRVSERRKSFSVVIMKEQLNYTTLYLHKVLFIAKHLFPDFV